uniref:Uncharacterized protein n=1 Tax=Palpitomonas bilix TaxID=652834 RepID=A0A7S3DLP4_9EUKA|mmetsp:Transcript_42418/g.109119  ORF Transcript_42418/g.109119 Transcript_42418/m.109119 type:complete len:133 (+) Transcript_42418:149-547(+)
MFRTVVCMAKKSSAFSKGKGKDTVKMVKSPMLELLQKAVVGIGNGEKRVVDSVVLKEEQELLRAYSRAMFERHNQMRKAEALKLACKNEAVRALPLQLRKIALEPDMRELPLHRRVPTETPPAPGWSRKSNM